MNQQIKERWIEALLSGDYEQGTSYLRTSPIGESEKFCCLGVLCDLYSKDGHGDWTPGQWGAWKMIDKDSLLPEDVMVWAGLEDDCGWSIECKTNNIHEWNNSSLTRMNDSGRTFAEIVEVIKEKL